MSVQVVIDMNLSPAWADLLQANGWSAVHWSSVGDPRATDREIMDWALSNGHVVFTHDLDFGTALALTHAAGPSVLQMRTQEVLPAHAGAVIAAALRQHESDLAAGALVVVEEARARVRVLPL